jgi:hypothetical protein
MQVCVERHELKLSRVRVTADRDLDLRKEAPRVQPHHIRRLNRLVGRAAAVLMLAWRPWPSW